MLFRSSKSQLPKQGSSSKEQAKKSFSRIQLARQLMSSLDQEYSHFCKKGPARIITQWKNLSAFSGKRVRVRLANKTIEGLVQDIDSAGALIVRLDNGFKQHVLTGDVIRVR